MTYQEHETLSQKILVLRWIRECITNVGHILTLAYLEVIQFVHSRIINHTLIIPNKFTKFNHDLNLEAKFHNAKRTLASKKIKEEKYNKCI
jgi:hypothetical protein